MYGEMIADFQPFVLGEMSRELNIDA